jgi:hypothetical protein
MAKSTYTGTQYNYQQLQKLWTDNGGDESVAPLMASIALAESSNGSPNGSYSGAFNPNDAHGGSTGIWQINSYGSTDPNVNATQAVAKYNTQGLNAWGSYTNGSYMKFDPNGVGQSEAATASNNNASGTAINPGSDFKTADGYQTLTENGASATVVEPTVVVNTGLDVTPWYNDTALITGNPRLRKEVVPVVFEIVLHDNHTGSDFTLSSQGKTGNAIDIQLNASMTSFSINSKHIFHNQRTRTGFHITLWGMQADMIEGKCSTGVFMNQLGLTDFFSTSTMSDQMKKLVTSGFSLRENPSTYNKTTKQTALLKAGGDLGGTFVGGAVNKGDYDTIVNKQTKQPQEAFRVAAQDAFQEFLSLFKNNGIVWNTGGKVPTGGNGSTTNPGSVVQSWSASNGVSSAQLLARNNDVLSRGHVLMKFKNTAYSGYFKTLSWQIDASKPYSFDFSFTFQVESTMSILYTPKNG